MDGLGGLFGLLIALGTMGTFTCVCMFFMRKSFYPQEYATWTEGKTKGSITGFDLLMGAALVFVVDALAFSVVAIALSLLHVIH